MSEAIFRENANAPTQHRSRLADLEPVDVGAGVGFVSVAVGLGLVWVPLALVLPGGLVFAFCMWRILRTPRVVR